MSSLPEKILRKYFRRKVTPTSGGRAGACTRRGNPSRTCRSSRTSRRGTRVDTREFRFDDIRNIEGEVVADNTYLPDRLVLDHSSLEVGRNRALERGWSIAANQ